MAGFPWGRRASSRWVPPGVLHFSFLSSEDLGNILLSRALLILDTEWLTTFPMTFWSFQAVRSISDHAPGMGMSRGQWSWDISFLLCTQRRVMLSAPLGSYCPQNRTPFLVFQGLEGLIWFKVWISHQPHATSFHHITLAILELGRSFAYQSPTSTCSHLSFGTLYGWITLAHEEHQFCSSGWVQDWMVFPCHCLRLVYDPATAASLQQPGQSSP